MRHIATICSRDMRSYFSSPIAYVIIGMFLLITGFFFYTMVSYFSVVCFQSMQQQAMEAVLNLTEMLVAPLVINISVVMLFMLPMLSMRSFAEEKKLGTIELLFTYPLTDLDIVLGKFCAVCSVFLVMLIPLLGYPLLVMYVGGVMLWKTFLTGLLGVVLLGISFLSLGVFISSLTENQIIATVVSFGLLMFFWIIGWVAQFVPVTVGHFLNALSIIEHFKSFAQGVIDTQDIVFYGLFTFFFLFLTMRVLESRNWRA